MRGKSRRRTLPRETGERCELDALDADQQQRRAGALGDDRRPLVDLHQRAGRRDASFGKDDARAIRLRRRGSSRESTAGFVGSTGIALTSARNGRAHHCVAMSVSTAKIGSPGRNAPSSRPSRNDAWLAAMTACGNAARDVLEAFDLDAIEQAQHHPHRALRQRPRSTHAASERHRAVPTPHTANELRPS